MGYDSAVIVAPLLTWPILVVSIVLILTSLVLALFILLHKSRGGGLSDLFGGGMTTGMGGTSAAERNLDKMTITVGLVWLASIIGLLVLYKFFGEIGVIPSGPPPEAVPTGAFPSEAFPTAVPSVVPSAIPTATPQ